MSVTRASAMATAHPPAALAPFVDAGVLSPADVHVTRTLARLAGEVDPEVLLAVALAVRAPRMKHVCVDLEQVRDTVVTEGEAGSDQHGPAAAGILSGGGLPEARLAELPWPQDVPMWCAALAASPLTAVEDPAALAEPADAGRDIAPLRLAGPRLYLDRYWRYERRVAAALTARAKRAMASVDLKRLAADLDRLFDGPAPDRQRVASALAVTRHLTIIAGGPGTGKTTIVAAILRLLDAQASITGREHPQVALTAPTGKAAARLTASLRAAATDIETADPADPAAARMRDVTATTVHRLLGRSWSRSRFRHGPHDPLPHDVVIVDETSMIDLSLLAKLLDALPTDAQLVLLGDPHQLASVEAGSVLGDMVGDPDAPPHRSAAVLDGLAQVVDPAHVADTTLDRRDGVHDAVVVLDRVHRFAAGSGLDRLAGAVRAGDADTVLDILDSSSDLTWVPITAAGAAGGRLPDGPLEQVRTQLVEAALAVARAAAQGDGAAALAGLDEIRVLCAHRHGDFGVTGWNGRMETWLAATGQLETQARWYVGRPVLVTTNDYRLKLWNGDLGVVVRSAESRVAVAFLTPTGDGVRGLAPARLGAVDTVHAMTVHKAQGTQVRHAVVVLPEPASRICTRELFYTAITRAQQHATVIASEQALRATIATRISRASGLGLALEGVRSLRAAEESEDRAP